MEKHVYEYGLIGNCSFQAHIHKDSNIGWMCWPRFDSSFIFGGLIDDEKGGGFWIKPSGEFRGSQQAYLENTNILTTTILADDGKYMITDFAPRFYQHDRYFKPLMLIRKVEPLEGTPSVRVCCEPRGNYGKTVPTYYQASNHIEYQGLEERVRLTSNFSLSYMMEQKSIALNETKYLVLTYGAPLEASLETTCEDFLMNTKKYWRGWVKNLNASQFHQDAINRSALALKIHQYEDTGAIIAAGTTSLPEFHNSGRTWDYRFCWLRDAYYILAAFNNIGHFEELERYFNYIVNVSVKSKERFQPLYSILGDARLDEKLLDLKGYMGNQPVRVGNQAYTHIQNDVYGQILLALLPLYIDRRFINTEREDSLSMIYDVLKRIDSLMDEPDAGLWEFRNLSQYHCYTYLFHWAGANAALRVAESFKDKEIEALAKKVIKYSSEKIEQCYDPEEKVYTQAIGSKNLDASNLQLIMMSYLPHDSQSARDHLAALERELKSDGGLFYRYTHADDFGKPETTFLICAFWYVEALACAGRMDEAIETFENLLEYSNSLGLLSEDIDARTGSQWGNFPQAYSHVGLVNAAYRISRKLDKPNFL